MVLWGYERDYKFSNFNLAWLGKHAHGITKNVHGIYDKD